MKRMISIALLTLLPHIYAATEPIMYKNFAMCVHSSKQINGHPARIYVETRELQGAAWKDSNGKDNCANLIGPGWKYDSSISEESMPDSKWARCTNGTTTARLFSNKQIDWQTAPDCATNIETGWKLSNQQANGFCNIPCGSEKCRCGQFCNSFHGELYCAWPTPQE